MTSQIQFTIKPELLGTLGTIAGSPVSSISPFNYAKGTTSSPDGIAQLTGLGICDSQGKLLADKQRAIYTLAQADAFTRIFLTTPQGVTEYISYFAPDGMVAGVTNDSGMQLVSFPAPNDAMLERIRQTIGFSIYRNGSFEAHLTRAETLVFSAMIDLQRKEMLRKFSDGTKAARLVYTPPAISAMLEIPPGNFQWLSSAFIDLFSRELVPKPDVIASILATLATKGLVIRDENGYNLSDDGILLSRGHLMPTMYLTMTSGKATTSGTTNVAGFSCIISGIHDLLYIDYNGDDIELRSVASIEINEYVSAFLKDTTIIAKLDSLSQVATAIAKEVPEKSQKYCTKCGVPLPSFARFCRKCGNQVSNEAT
ncbi:MAG: zinc ribbon domain-containing protein [Methanomicrobiales archaeon]